MYESVIGPLMSGFATALQPQYIIYAFAGSFLGTAIGVLPGIGSAGALALMLPIILTLDPVGSIIMLACAYTGVMYGGSTASILLNVPGDTSAVVATFDGYPMAKAGRAGPALCIAAIAGYIAGTIGVVGLMLLSPIIATFALAFSAPEYFALMLFGLTAISSLAGASFIKALIAMSLGLMVATVGTDATGVTRYAFRHPDLLDGISLLPIVLGLFAVSEVIMNARRLRIGQFIERIQYRIYITLKEVTRCLGAIARGGFAGFFIGVLPGAGAGIATFIAYTIETQVSRNPENFGKGEIKGVAGPEAANNAASAGSFVPMLALAIPGSSTAAVMLIGMQSVDIFPGPLLFTERPDVVWGLIAALYIGNVMLLLLNLPLVGIFVRILDIPIRILLSGIVVLCIAGVYSSNYAVLELILLCAFGVIGYYMRRYDFPLAPFILAVVLGGPMEQALRTSMIMTRGNIIDVIDRPIVSLFLVLMTISALLPIYMRFRAKKRRLAQRRS